MSMKIPEGLSKTLAISWRVAVFLVVFGLLSAAFFVPFSSALSEWAQTSPIRARLFPDIAGAIAMVLATWVMTRLVDHRPFQTIGFAPEHVLRDTLIGLAVGSGWLAASVGAALLTGVASFSPPPAITGALLGWAAISVFFNVLTQQLLLCGYIYQTIRSRTTFTITLLVSATLFSAYHVGAFQGAWLPAVNVFVAGAFFCLAFEITGNLWLGVAIHFAWNFLLGPVLGLTISGSSQLGIGWIVFEVKGPDLLTGGAFGLEGGLIVTLTTAIGVGTMILIERRRGKS